MLRGQGTLKELLGQDVVASSYARKKRSRALDAEVGVQPGASNLALSSKKRKLRSTGQPAASPRECKPLPAWVTPKASSRSPIEFDSNAAGNNPDTTGPSRNHGPPAADSAKKPSGASGADISPAHQHGDCSTTSGSCPMCGLVLSNDDQLINNHIGVLIAHCIALQKPESVFCPHSDFLWCTWSSSHVPLS